MRGYGIHVHPKVEEALANARDEGYAAFEGVAHHYNGKGPAVRRQMALDTMREVGIQLTAQAIIAHMPRHNGGQATI